MKEERFAEVITVEDYTQIPKFNKNSIIITATQNLKNNNLLNGVKTVVSFSELVKQAQDRIDYKKCINSSEFKYIISQEIKSLFDLEKSIAYKNCVDSLEELFVKLILNNIETKDINKIDFDRNYSNVEKDIFEIYKRTYKRISKGSRISKVYLVNEMTKILYEYDRIIFIGFVFFNDIQESLIKSISKGNIVFINKPGEFIKDDLIVPLLNKLNCPIKYNYLHNENKSLFSEIENKIFTNEKVDTKQEDIIKFYEPFSNREDEFLFIAKEISEHIKSRNIDIKQINNIIQDYSIVLTKNKDQLSRILNDAFGEYGVFVPNQNEYDNLKTIYYSKQEFLNEKILYKNKELSYLEKLDLFNSFKRIVVSGLTLQTNDFPIGKFITSVYKVVAFDLDLDKFKTLLNSQWYSKKMVDEISIQDFYKIESYFEKLTSLKEWKQRIGQLIDLKQKVLKEKDYNLHPLYVVNESSLKYIKNYLNFLDSLIDSLKVNGSISKQIKVLIKSFNLRNIKPQTDKERETLDEFIRILESIKSNDSVKMEYTYFAEHIKELIDQYVNIQEKNNNDYKIAIVNMENATKYDYVFFPMFEENKYPRIINIEFPYTNTIREILENELKLKIQMNYDIKYHLKMSKHIFKNVFGFTKKNIYFTFINKECGVDVDISIYAKDIARVLNRDINFISVNEKYTPTKTEMRELMFREVPIKEVNINQLLSRYLCAKQFYFSICLDKQLCYRDNFLLNFYAKALVVNKFFINLTRMPKEHNLFSLEFEKDVNSIFEKTYEYVMKYFSLFNDNEKKDIRISSKKYVNDFIDIHFKHGKFATKKCRFILGDEKVISDKILVKSRPTLIMQDTKKQREIEFDISKMVDYLVSSAGGKKIKLEHFDELIDRLDNGNKYDDKMDLVNYASFKVNTQLNNKKYYADGVERIKSLIHTLPLEYSNQGITISSYCRFCKLKNICKEVLIDG